MNVAHQLAVVATCPVDDTVDVYQVTVETDRLLAVEDILNCAQSLATEPLYQEELTQRMASTLGAKVTTRGVHSRVATTVVVEP